MVLTFCKTFKDPFLLDPPPWFLSFVWCEILLQFPFFFVASYAFWKGYIELTNAKCTYNIMSGKKDLHFSLNNFNKIEHNCTIFGAHCLEDSTK